MAVDEGTLEILAQQLGQALQKRGWMLTLAESCTGGWAAQAATANAGSSAWFDRGFVTYSNAAKMDMLGVQESTIEAFGAVSTETVAEMAVGALQRSQADLACAISGIAGPSGGSPDKPVGWVCFAWLVKGQSVRAECRQFFGDRRTVRAAAVAYVYGQALNCLPDSP